MDKSIKNFIKGKYAIKINNKYEMEYMLSFINILGKKRTTAYGKYPKYFYIKRNILIKINHIGISKCDKTIDFYEDQHIFNLFVMFYRPIKRQYIDMRIYKDIFKEERENIKKSFWKNLIEKFKKKGQIKNENI